LLSTLFVRGLSESFPSNPLLSPMVYSSIRFFSPEYRGSGLRICEPCAILFPPPLHFPPFSGFHSPFLVPLPPTFDPPPFFRTPPEGHTTFPVLSVFRQVTGSPIHRPRTAPTLHPPPHPFYADSPLLKVPPNMVPFYGGVSFVHACVANVQSLTPSVRTPSSSPLSSSAPQISPLAQLDSRHSFPPPFFYGTTFSPFFPYHVPTSFVMLRLHPFFLSFLL